MDVETIVEALDAGFDINQVAMMERLVRELRSRGVINEAELYDAMV